ncbi:putative bifunctional diguanylate cyclase/phosphodiesterase [Nitratireductor sp. CH_MIT9313-5]|uniref:putative bifunctional diguanylate cyclase/phosphodiesterase n=1 Tax=Nitratireductor sp. CH_MIT9313-5 TaxID=3107764 RepID=UPI00300AA9F3
MGHILQNRLLGLHDKLIDYACNPGGSFATSREIAGRFVTLFLLAALLVPWFVFQYSYTGFSEAAMALATVGVCMTASFWVFRHTGNVPLTRDLFLGSFFCFLVWQSFYLEGLTPPGSVWLVVMPVVSVLLGSRRSGVIWLLICIAALLVSYVLTDPTRFTASIYTSRYQLLHTISICCMMIAVFLFVMMVDVARARAYRALEETAASVKLLAERDELSGLHNRRYFYEQLEQRLTRHPAEAHAVLLTDLDGFKEINDTHGHLVGDELLKAAAEAFSDISARENATIARLGGDEFAILVAGSDVKARAERVAQLLLERVCQPFYMAGQAAHIGVSIGIASTHDGISASEILRRADVAMYAAKQGGKNQFVYYRSELDTHRSHQLQMAQELAAAMAAEAIEVHYQPIVDAKTYAVTAAEALARWTRADGTRVSPAEFIPIAEESGLINDLGLYILRRACRDGVEFGALKLSVNLSPVQFTSENLVGDILEILRETNYPASQLELEVTETYLIEHPERAQPVIEKLQAAGITVTLDDFGTGYSSIGYLRQYGFDRMKIDRSLVSGIAEDESARSIIQAAAILAESLSLKLTAEGVESEEEAVLLRLAGCSELQGYFFGRPRSPGAFTRFLETGSTARSVQPAY